MTPALETRMSSAAPAAASAAATRPSTGSAVARGWPARSRRARPARWRSSCQRLLAGAGEHHVGALGVQRPGDRPADAAGGAGDQGRLAGEIEHGPRAPRGSWRRLRGRPGVFSATRLGVGRDALDHAGQHLAGAELGEAGHAALARQPLDALAPAHPAGDLLDQQAADRLRIVGRPGGDIGDQRTRAAPRS